MSKELDSELNHGVTDMGNGWHMLWLNADKTAHVRVFIRQTEYPDGSKGFEMWNPSIVLADDAPASADMRQMQERTTEFRERLVPHQDFAHNLFRLLNIGRPGEMITDLLPDALDRVRKMQEELEELRKDKALVDFMDENPTAVWWDNEIEAWKCSPDGLNYEDDLRCAIIAAMADSGE